MTTLNDPLGMVMIEDDAPEPVTVPEGEDPWAVLATMQKFMPGESRGQCEITAKAKPDSYGRPMDMVIGYTMLIGHPERVRQPVFDTATRVVEVVELAEWLKARGFEVSACKWQQPNSGQFSVSSRAPAATRWRLITGEAKLPPLPPPPTDPAELAKAQAHYTAMAQQIAQAGWLPPGGGLLGGPPGSGLLGGRGTLLSHKEK